MRGRARDVLALVAWTAFLVAALFGLHALGDRSLAAPTWPGIGRWLDSRDAPTVVFSLVRLVLVGLGWHLLVSTLVATTLRVLRADTAARAVESWSPGPVRRLVQAAAGLSVASLMAVSAVGASEGDEPVTMRRLPDATRHDTGAGAADADVTVTMTRLADTDAWPPPETSPARHIVVPGDHLWSIAEDALGGAWRRRPTDAEIDPYWRQLIETNRRGLPNPADPDLLVPSMEIELPPTPPRPRR